MKITGTRIEAITMDLAEPYTIAYETVATVINVVLYVDTDTGITGVGCAAPAPMVTGETTEAIQDNYARIIAPVLIGAAPLNRAAIRSRLKAVLPQAPTTLAMVDMAMLDILGKHAGLPVHQILGGYRERIITSVTIGILPVSDTVSRAQDLKQQGFRALKIKGGCDVDADLERLARVREAVGPDIDLRFDANEGYNEADALQFAAGAHRFGISVIEQPTTRREPGLLSRITQSSSVPVMADESLFNIQDAMSLARRNAADMFNIKLMKVGGITPALHVLGLASALGIDVMVGCMDEMAVSISAGLHLALSHPIVRFADLDGHLDLKRDPSASALRLSDGFLYPSTQPGFGWNP